MKAQDLAQSKRADGPSSAGRSDSNRGGGGGGGEPSATGGAHTPGPPRFRKLSQQRHETLDAGRPAGGDVAAACAQAVNAAYLTDTATDESAGRAAGGLHVSPGRGEEARPATTTTTMTTVTATATTTTAAAAAAATSLKGNGWQNLWAVLMVDYRFRMVLRGTVLNYVILILAVESTLIFFSLPPVIQARRSVAVNFPSPYCLSHRPPPTPQSSRLSAILYSLFLSSSFPCFFLADRNNDQ